MTRSRTLTAELYTTWNSPITLFFKDLMTLFLCWETSLFISKTSRSQPSRLNTTLYKTEMKNCPVPANVPSRLSYKQGLITFCFKFGFVATLRNFPGGVSRECRCIETFISVFQFTKLACNLHFFVLFVSKKVWLHKDIWLICIRTNLVIYC